MTDPLAILSLALAAAGGRVDDVPVAALVAAGHALLQRSGGLVRALSGRRAALQLPLSGAWLVALAAADGRGAMVLPIDDPSAPAPVPPSDDVAGARFTFRHLAPDVHAAGGDPLVLLDDAPRHAVVVLRGVARTVDLGSHFPLTLVGDPGAEGLDEECLGFADGGTTRWYTHRELLARARAAADALGFTPMHSLSVHGAESLESLIPALGLLLRGGHLVTARAASGVTPPRTA